MQKCKNARKYYEECLSIPLYYGLKIMNKLYNENNLRYNYKKFFKNKKIYK